MKKRYTWPDFNSNYEVYSLTRFVRTVWEHRMSAEPIYRVVFLNQSEIYEIYVKNVYQSDLYGFLEIEGFLFGERRQMVVDPSEERLKAQFQDVSRTYIPLHSVIRVDEVEKQGVGKITEVKGGNVTQFPGFPFGPGGGGNKTGWNIINTVGDYVLYTVRR